MNGQNGPGQHVACIDRYKTLKTALCLCLLMQCLCLWHCGFGSIGPYPTNVSKIQQRLDEETEITNNILRNYDKRFIPTIEGYPLTVSLDVVVSNVLRLENMEAEMIIYIRQTWYDYRLRFNSTKRIKVREHLLDKIWLPDIRIVNAKDVKQLPVVGGTNMNIHPDGKVYFSQMAVVTMSCPMKLHNFPMDRQTCFLNFSSSYAYGKSLLAFKKSGKVIVKKAYLEQYTFVGAVMQEVNSTRPISLVAVVLIFQRRTGFYIIQIYLPAAFLVVLSWLAFLVEPSNITDRLTLEITMILSIVFLLGGINDSVPHVSYAKASDWFVIVSFAFVFLALLETMLVYRITTMQCRKETVLVLSDQNQNAEGEKNCRESQNDGAGPWINIKCCNPAAFIDKVSLIAFPGLFIGFIIFYSLYYNMRD